MLPYYFDVLRCMSFLFLEIQHWCYVCEFVTSPQGCTSGEAVYVVTIPSRTQTAGWPCPSLWGRTDDTIAPWCGVDQAGASPEVYSLWVTVDSLRCSFANATLALVPYKKKKKIAPSTRVLFHPFRFPLSVRVPLCRGKGWGAPIYLLYRDFPPDRYHFQGPLS